MTTTPAVPSVDTTPVPSIPGTKIEQTDAPQSEWDTIRAQLRESPLNPDGWLKLVELTEDSGDLEKIKETYEALLQTYPNTSSAQIRYINHFLNPPSFAFVQTLFKRFLIPSPCVDLWKFYLTFVRRVNTNPTQREQVRMAYEFTLNHVGQDKDSSEIWIDYIQFIKSGEANTTWEDQQKMDALRKVYHRVVQIPIEGVDKLWQELEAFENNLNRITAKKFMGDLSPAHMQARAVLRGMDKHMKILFPPQSSHDGQPPLVLPRVPTFSQNERALVGAWKAYLKWEESNPLELDEKDRGVLVQRVQAVYRKAVIRMRYFAEIWYLAFVWTNNAGKSEEAVRILKAGIEANPSSFLLNFEYAETQEIVGNSTEVHSTYEKLFEVLRRDLESLETRIGSAPSSANNSLDSQTNGINGDHTPDINASQTTQTSSQGTEEKPMPRSKELAERRTEYGLAIIMYMRFCNRAENLQSFRNAFKQARKDRWTPWEVYEAAALMEYHCTKNAVVATKIFEKGLEIFTDEIDFVLRYLGFLISINDETNARALFEGVIGRFSGDRARPLWERWARYVYQFEHLEEAQKLEKRIAEAYPNDPPLKRFAQRHTYLGTDAIASRDLGVALIRQHSTTANASVKIENSINAIGAVTSKRPPSPESSRRRDERDHASHKRQRVSPPRDRERDRDRDRDWDRDRDRDRDRRETTRRRYGSPSPWERERERERDGPSRRPYEKEREEDKPSVTLPPIVSWFVGTLPESSKFDGPVFRTDDLLQVFRNAVIPNVNRPRSPTGLPPRSTRPPPDYGPYQGPSGGARRR